MQQLFSNNLLKSRVTKVLAVVFFSFIVWGCSTSGDERQLGNFPLHAVLDADAEGNYEERQIECLLYLLIDQVENQPKKNRESYAVMGGEAYRSFSTEGGGMSFWGLSHESVKITFPTPDKITISSRIHQPTGESRFWDGILYFEGEAVAEQHWEGNWKCYPVDTRGDSVGIIDGTWIIESAE